jgi:serine-type D-Ala-D-Ala carboxypeptidase/endopeptidase (penicillin-binding protein 4)
MPKPARRGAPGRTRLLAIVVLALLNLLTIGAGGALAGLLPVRLALWKIPSVAGRPLVRPTVPLSAVGSSGPVPTAAGLSASLSGLLSTGYLGPHVTAVVADLASGKVLFSQDGDSPSAPASTTKLATAVASLDTLGPGARFSTRVMGPAGSSAGSSAARQAGGAVNIVLVGGGDPTLAAGRPPPADYPQPATLQALAAATARSLRAQHHTVVRLSDDTAMYSGPGLAPGWSDSYVTTGNVTPISALEVDQGRLLPDGLPQDADDPDNLNPRSFDPAGDADAAFRRFLARDGITVSAVGQVTSTRGMAQLAVVSSPPLSAMVAQMLTESNNVIAENLARHVALALGLPATFSGAARAVTTVASRLGAGTGIHLVDGSGLSPYDRIPAATLVKLVSLAASPAHPQLRPAITGLPVAGFSGTLSPGQSVFGAMAAAARGMVRAKTGNLDTVVSLAGLVEDRNGSVLTFAFMADQIPGAQDLEPAAGVVDRLAETLAGCGCG